MKINPNERILIAGGHGMVGSAIFRQLKKSGYGSKEKGGKIFRPKRIDLDYTYKDKLLIWFKENKPSIVIIAAAKVGGILANNNFKTDFLLENMKIQNNLIETSWQYGVKKLLFLGSSCIYPKLCPQPIKEEYLLTGSLEETNQWYALAKISGLKLCEALSKQYQFNAISLMPTNLYGPGDNYNQINSHVMPALIKKISDAKRYNINEITCWGDGSPLREFLHVNDLAKACVIALESWEPNDKISPKSKDGNPLYWLNVGTGSDISIKNLANLIANAINFKGSIKWDTSKPNGTPRKLLDISKIKEIGWEPKINLEEGIKSTIYNFQKERVII